MKLKEMIFSLNMIGLIVFGILGFLGMLIFSTVYTAFMGEAAFNGAEYTQITLASVLFKFSVFIPLLLTLFLGYHIVRVIYYLHKGRVKKNIVYGVIFVLSALCFFIFQLYHISTTGYWTFFQLQEGTAFVNFLAGAAVIFSFLTTVLLSCNYLNIFKHL